MTDFPPYKNASLHKEHFTVSTYAITQENFNRIIAQLDQAKADNEKLKQLFAVQLDVIEQNKKLTDMIHELNSKLKMAEIENSILKINGKAARNKDGI